MNIQREERERKRERERERREREGRNGGKEERLKREELGHGSGWWVSRDGMYSTGARNRAARKGIDYQAANN